MASSKVSSMFLFLVLLLLVFPHLDEALGEQMQHRKLEETNHPDQLTEERGGFGAIFKKIFSPNNLPKITRPLPQPTPVLSWSTKPGCKSSCTAKDYVTDVVKNFLKEMSSPENKDKWSFLVNTPENLPAKLKKVEFDLALNTCKAFAKKLENNNPCKAVLKAVKKYKTCKASLNDYLKAMKTDYKTCKAALKAIDLLRREGH